jgi:hypothetical protein
MSAGNYFWEHFVSNNNNSNSLDDGDVDEMILN